MKAFRKTIFWLHLGAGVFAGLVVLIMSVTGVLLTYEKQMVEWADRGYRVSPPSSASQRAPIETLLARASEAKGALPTMVTLRSDAAAPVAFGFGRESTLFVNPYSGEVLGEGSRGIREFFSVVTAWHRWLGAETENRPLGKAVTGACNLAFLFIVISGPYLWWPRQWTWNNLKAVTLFRGGLRGRARDFNWHNVLGLWCSVPLFFVILGATVISYPWASDLVYRAVGEEPPARSGPPGAAGRGRSGGPGSERGGEQRPGSRDARQNQQTVTGLTEPTPSTRPEGSSNEATRADVAARKETGGPRPGGHSREAEGRPSARAGARAERNQPAATLNLEGLNQAFTRAEKQVSGWRTISLRLPGSPEEPLSFSIDQGAAGQPHLRSTLVLDRHTSDVVKWETFSDASRGRRIRMLLRFIHTGEVFGIPGQTVAGIASAGAVVLVYTGFALSWRRFRAWLVRRRSRASNQVLAEG